MSSPKRSDTIIDHDQYTRFKEAKDADAPCTTLKTEDVVFLSGRPTCKMTGSEQVCKKKGEGYQAVPVSKKLNDAQTRRNENRNCIKQLLMHHIKKYGEGNHNLDIKRIQKEKCEQIRTLWSNFDKELDNKSLGTLNKVQKALENVQVLMRQGVSKP